MNTQKTETRIKFYADSDTDTNKYFCYTIDELHPKEAIFRQFAQGLTIRALWIEKIDLATRQPISDDRVENLDELWNEFVSLSIHQRRKYSPKKRHGIRR